VKTISSAQTFLMKIVFPVLWITGFGIITLSLWLGWIHIKTFIFPSIETKWRFLAIWIIGTPFVIWSCSGLKRVRLDSTHLYISNFRKEIAVPLNNIANVTENRWINIHPITIHFQSSTAFGQRITFMPTVRPFGFRSSHPIVAELKRQAAVLKPSAYC
jgi:general stress protein CsbA